MHVVLAVLCCPVLHTCREKQGVNNRPMPSYCCWQGVLCCHEHSAFTATRQQACAYNSVYGLQLRAGNLRGKLDSTVMGHLQTLHQHGLTVLDLSRNQLTGDFPASMGQLTNLHALLLGANSECVHCQPACLLGAGAGGVFAFGVMPGIWSRVVVACVSQVVILPLAAVGLKAHACSRGERHRPTASSPMRPTYSGDQSTKHYSWCLHTPLAHDTFD